MRLLCAVILAGLAGIQSVAAQTVFNYTGGAQTYVVPAGAGGIQITANGAGGGGGGADENGAGGNGGAGATVTGVYLAPAGTVVTVTVGGGGGFGWTSNFGHTCATSAGGGGGGGGGGGLAGGAGGEAGCSGWSGGGGGGGGASEVLVAGAPLLIAGGGSGGQGGSWNSTANPGQNSTATGALVGGVGSVGAAGVFPGNNSDGGGGGGGGGGCPGGAGGPMHPDQSGGASGILAGAGASCASTAVASFAVSGAGGGAGGLGDVADAGSGPDPGGSAGGNGSVTLTPLYIVSGAVYADANHNGAPDAGETGTGIAGLYVKLAVYSGGACQSPAVAAAAVNATSGSYTLPALATGTYCVILTNSAALANIGAYGPPGWLGTQNPTGIAVVATAANAGLPVNFGLYDGSSVALSVFADTGAGGGTANDGVRNGAETGLGGIAVTATVGGAAVATATTAGSGAALLWLPASMVGASVTLTPAAGSGASATGGTAGTTGGAYARPAVSFTVAAGTAYAGVSFGLIPPNAFAPTGLQSAAAGGTVFYPHTFTAGSAGQVTFAVTSAATPALAGWNEGLYLDTACTGVFAGGNPVIAAPVAVQAGQAVCLLVKEFVPATAPLGAQNRATLSATLAYSGSAAPARSALTLVDTTTVVAGGGTQLVKQVQNLTLGGAYGTSNSALPGQTLQYQLTFSNDGSTPLATVVVDDATPAFTGFVKAQCPATLPAGLTACNLSAAPPVGGQGALQWTFTGTLAAGAQVAVTYQVTVAQ